MIYNASNIVTLQDKIDNDPDFFESSDVDWIKLNRLVVMPESFIKKFIHKIPIEELLIEQSMSESFIVKNIFPILDKDENKKYATYLCHQWNLRESFIELIINKYNLHDDYNFFSVIGYDNCLSENFIEKYIINNKNLLNNLISSPDLCNSISFNQKLSKKFIQKHIDKLNTDLLLKNKYINKEELEDLILLKEII